MSNLDKVIERSQVTKQGIDIMIDNYFRLDKKLTAAQAEIADLTEQLNDKRRFCYAVEQALDGLKGDYIEIIKGLRKERGK